LTTVQGLKALPDRALTRLGGIVSQVAKKVTKATKENWAIVTLEDLDGVVEVLVYSDTYRQYASELQQDEAVLICGEVNAREDAVKLVAYEIYPLRDAPRHFAKRVAVHVPAAGLVENHKLDRIKDALRMHPGNVPVVICLQFPSGEKVFLDTDVMFRTFPEPGLVHDIERELGEGSVYVAVSPDPLRKPRPGRGQRRFRT
jgi:DNA polymerase-3 subunit alpha